MYVCASVVRRQSKCKSGKAQRYSYDGYKTALTAAKGNLKGTALKIKILY